MFFSKRRRSLLKQMSFQRCVLNAKVQIHLNGERDPTDQKNYVMPVVFVTQKHWFQKNQITLNKLKLSKCFN